MDASGASAQKQRLGVKDRTRKCQTKSMQRTSRLISLLKKERSDRLEGFGAL
jgi:hypothetical protein